jgi:ssDNA-binding Zn-finger/Zn-ribbon topoisomerase 1
MRPEIIEVIGVINKKTRAKCRCPLCGKVWVVSLSNIETGRSKSCGCSHYITRDYLLPFEKEIRARWQSMKSRVKKGWSYIEKGITICPEWYNFNTFYDWAIVGFDPNLEIDRRDNKRGYSPDNCRWVTRLENLRNRDRQTINEEIAFDIKTRLLNGSTKKELAIEFNCSWQIVDSIYVNKAWKDICEKAERQWLLDKNTLFLPQREVVIRPKRGKYNIAVRSKTTSQRGRNELYAEYREKRQHI